MRKFTQAAGSERGIALVAALLALLVLSTLTTAFIFVANTETSTTTNYKALTQGRYMAEAGVERTLYWMRYNYAALPDTSYNTSKSPVEFNSARVVLSGRDGVTANYPDSSKQADFHSNANLYNHPWTQDLSTSTNVSSTTTRLSGTYSTSATLLAFRNTQALDSTTTSATEMWQVTSEGSVTGTRGPAATVQVDAIVERRGTPVFNYGLFATGTGCGVLGLSSLSPAGVVDSWNSSNGGTYSLTKNQTPSGHGDIGANGGANLSGSFDVWGSLYTPLVDQYTHACSDGAPNALNDTSTGAIEGEPRRDEGKIRLPEALTFDDPPPISNPPLTSNQAVNSSTCGTTIPTCHRVGSTYTLDPAQYGNLTLFGSGNTFMFSTGTYTINSINMISGKLQIAPGGPVRIQVAGASLQAGVNPISINAGAWVNTNGVPVPSNLSFAYSGTGTLQVNGEAYGVIYAPNAFVNMANGNWYGAMVMNKFSASGGASFHYDLALLDNFCLTLPWRVVSMSRNKY